MITPNPEKYTRESTVSFISRCKNLPLRRQHIEYWRRAEQDMLSLDPTGIPGTTVEAQRVWETGLAHIRAELGALGG